MYEAVYKKVMREYEQKRVAANRKIAKHNAEIYKKVPEIQEIDRRLTELAIGISKQILSQSKDTQELVLDLKSKIENLNAMKRDLLKENRLTQLSAGLWECENCKDTGYIADKKCLCLKQRLIDNYYELSNIKEVMKSENFDTFDFRYYSEETDPKNGLSPRANMQLIYASCMDFVTGGEGNLLFYGETGLGKTFLCNCIAKDMLDKEKTVLYVTAPRMFKKIEDYRFNRDEMPDANQQTELIFQVDLLIIDDLGSEFSTVVTNTELFNIINSRLLEKRPTVISTNLNLTDFQSQYSDRIVSRLFGNYKLLRFFGDDIRVKKKLGAYK